MSSRIDLLQRLSFLRSDTQAHFQHRNAILDLGELHLVPAEEKSILIFLCGQTSIGTHSVNSALPMWIVGRALFLF